MAISALFPGRFMGLLLLLVSMTVCPSAWACRYLGQLLPCPDDCLELGGQRECRAPIAFKSQNQYPADGEGWQYANCRESGLDNCPFWALQCCAAGGTWAGGGPPVNCGGMQCTNLPEGIWAGGGGFANESLAFSVTDGLGTGNHACGSNPCPITVSGSGWGVQNDSFNCWSGGNETTLGIITRQLAKRRYTGMVASTIPGVCDTPYDRTWYLLRTRTAACPVGFNWRGQDSKCVRYTPLFCPRKNNPVAIDVGAKLHREPLFDFPSAFGGMSIHYNSLGWFGTSPDLEIEDASNFWTLSYSRQLSASTDTTHLLASIREDDGRVLHYRPDGMPSIRHEDDFRRLLRVPAVGDLQHWERHDRLGGIEVFDSAGRLLEIRRADGSALSLQYGLDDRLTALIDQTGRRVSVSWNGPQLESVTDPTGASYVFGYDEHRRLISIDRPDDTWRRFGYLNGSQYGHLLTEIREGDRVDARYQYDGLNRVTRTRLMLDDTNSVAERTYTYRNNFPSIYTEITQPSGAVETSEFTLRGGSWRVYQRTLNCPSCGASQFARTFRDDAGLPSTETDFFGQVVRTYQRDTIGRELVRTELDLRRTEHVWHPQWLVAEETSLRKTANAAIEGLVRRVVNDRGQIKAICQIDPNSATAMNYVCGSAMHAPDRVRQTRIDYCESTDADYGSSSCVVPGAVRSIDGPRTDVDDRAWRSYYVEDHSGCVDNPNDCPYRRGDLWRISNALGHTTEAKRYDAAGRITRRADANGVLSDLEYHARGWPSAIIRRARADGSPDPDDRILSLEYESYGEIKRVLQPNDAGTEFCRDGAHRLTAIVRTTRMSPTRCVGSQPAAGTEAIVFELDASGNRVKETIRGTDGQIERLLARQYDSLNRLRSLLHSPYAALPDLDDPAALKTRYSYDANGKLDTLSDPLGRVTDYGLDPLNRLIQIIQDKDTAGASGEIAATSRFEFDARDNLRKVIDPNGLTTEYVFDGLNDRISVLSPDRGGSQDAFDSAGNRIRRVDARGVETHFSYDALNRLTAMSYTGDLLSDSFEDATANPNMISFVYDQRPAHCPADEGYSVGRLARVVDATGEISFCYDREGQLRRQQQVTAGRTLITTYRYDKAGLRVAMSYPSGLSISELRDDFGRTSALSLALGSTQLGVIDHIQHLPFGPASEITFADGQMLSKQWDLNFWPQGIGGSALDHQFALSASGRITEISRANGAERIYLDHDRLDRLQSVRDQNQALIEAFAYDAVGNRNSRQIGQGPPQNFVYDSGSHRLLAIGADSRSYDPIGNTLTGFGADADLRAHYDAGNRLIEVADAQAARVRNAYNGFGQRVLSSEGDPAGNLPTQAGGWGRSGVRGFVYDRTGQLLSTIHGGNPIVFEEILWVGNTPVARVESSGGQILRVHAIHSDHLNTPRALSHLRAQDGQAAGTVVWTWAMDQGNAELGSNAFGTLAANQDADGNGVHLRFDLRFPGQQLDPATGLHYNYFRDYEPATGRYLESDPIGLRGGLSTYGYAEGAPWHRTDALGLSSSGSFWDNFYCLFGPYPADCFNRNPPERDTPVPPEETYTAPPGLPLTGMMDCGVGGTLLYLNADYSVAKHALEYSVNALPELGAGAYCCYEYASCPVGQQPPDLSIGLNRHLGVSVSQEKFCVKVGKGFGIGNVNVAVPLSD